MGEEHIARTTVYLTKKQKMLLKAKGINLSRAVRQLVTELLNESEEERLRQEIRELENALMEKKAKLEYIMAQRKQEQEVEESLMKVAEKLAAYLTKRFTQWREAFTPDEKKKVVGGAVRIVKLDYNIDVDDAHICSIFEKAASNGSAIKPQDVAHLLEGTQWKKRRS